MKVGIGFDAHRFSPGRRLLLGGVEIACEMGLAGHSDADVLLHAVMDAMLGACGSGDIGRVFPDSDPAYLDASSIGLLERVSEVVASKGYACVNVDATVICEQPKISPYRDRMEELIAEALGLPPEAVSVKATTTEGMGFSGRGEGIACIAVALLEAKDG